MNKLTRFVRHQNRVRHAIYMTDRHIMRGVRKIALILLSFIALHMLAMVVFEGLSAWQAFWLTL
ncbi:MAG: two pore domain potassium channel family protein, partial [Pseudomonadota bacterium]|nr:two pore domain potassium channel family protein [Pseudomonadota bacterium]